MLDQHLYNQILDAAYKLLQQNIQTLGQRFCEGFMIDYDPKNGQQSMNNAIRFQNWVSEQGTRMNNGQNNISVDQLFYIVGQFINNTAQMFAQQQQPQQNGFGGGFNRPMGGGFGNNGGGMGFSQNRGLGFGNNGAPGPGSNLTDTTEPRVTPMMAPAPVPSTLTMPPLNQEATTTMTYAPNPLDDFPTTGVSFTPVSAKTVWGREKPKDNRIVLGGKEDLKTQDQRFGINRYSAFHQTILNDPMDVVKDFFDVVPDNTLSNPFLFSITYNHLSILELPTRDFVLIRDQVKAAIEKDSSGFIHKIVNDILKPMAVGTWRAVTTYLVEHINRALFLACRLNSQPAMNIKIKTFDDIDEILSSSWQTDFTRLPEGRRRLENIVGTAIWNALVLNASPLFVDGEDVLPTHAIQSSPAFPYAIDDVYPNKFSIPLENDAMKEQFFERLQEHELSKRTYILTKRSVVITNILGKNVLPKIKNDASLIQDPVACQLNTSAIPFADEGNYDARIFPVVPYVTEAYPSDQLTAYYADREDMEDKELESFSRRPSTHLPVDQTFFAVQYGTPVTTYLKSFDVFTTLDSTSKANDVILGNHKLSILKTTA